MCMQLGFCLNRDLAVTAFVPCIASRTSVKQANSCSSLRMHAALLLHKTAAVALRNSWPRAFLSDTTVVVAACIGMKAEGEVSGVHTGWLLHDILCQSRQQQLMASARATLSWLKLHLSSHHNHSMQSPVINHNPVLPSLIRQPRVMNFTLTLLESTFSPRQPTLSLSGPTLSPLGSTAGTLVAFLIPSPSTKTFR